MTPEQHEQLMELACDAAEVPFATGWPERKALYDYVDSLIAAETERCAKVASEVENDEERPGRCVAAAIRRKP